MAVEIFDAAYVVACAGVPWARVGVDRRLIVRIPGAAGASMLQTLERWMRWRKEGRRMDF